jgi:hypothetical protein
MTETITAIELSPSQAELLDSQPQPVVVRDPRTGQEYRLVRQEVYEQMRAFIKPFSRNWDNPEDDDLIRKDI